MFKIRKNSIFTKLAIIIPAITVVFWIVSSSIVVHFLKKSFTKEFTTSNAKMLNSIAQQSVNDLRFYDFYQLRRTLHDFYDESYMDYFALYTPDMKPFATYPSGQFASTDISFVEKLVKDNISSDNIQKYYDVYGEGRFHFQQKVKDENGNIVGFLFVGGRTSWLDSMVRSQIFYFFILGFTVLLIEILVMVYFAHRFTKPIEQLVNTIKIAEERSPEELIPTILAQPPLEGSCYEVDVFDSVVRKLLGTLKDYQEKEMQLSVQATIGRLTSHFAHDIRSPITNISHYLSSHTPQEGSPTEEIERYDAARKNLKKINSMADELTTYAKAKEIRKFSVNIKEILDEARRDQLELANNKKIKINVDCDPGMKAYIDTDKITRVLNNMVLNSIQAISQENGEISLIAALKENGIEITVKDNGSGIAPEHIARVFDSSFTHGKIKGTGLGLAYCKNVVEAHGGSIELESAIGKGAMFKIILPECLVGTRPVDKTADPLAVTSSATSNQWLVIDDTKAMRDQWREIITKQKLPPPIEMSSAEEVHKSGLDFAQMKGAIVDYIFENSNATGLDIIQFLRYKGLQKVYLCTGNYNDEKVKKEAARLKVASIIPKPIPEDIADPTTGIFRPS